MDSSVLEFFKENHLLSFQVEYTSSIHRHRFLGENPKAKVSWCKGILDLDFDLRRCIIRDEENTILTQSFTGFQKQGNSEDETDKFMTLIFRHDEWQIIPQNIAEEECIRHVTQYISDDQSVRIEDIVKSGVNKGIIGLDHAHVMKHGLVQQCDSNGSRLKLSFLVLIPGKLFGFQEIEGQQAFLVMSLFNAKVTTLPEVAGFQLHVDTCDPLYFNPVQEAEWSSWAKELNASIDLTKDAVDGVLVTPKENSEIEVQEEEKQKDSSEVQAPLRRESQLIVTPVQARQLSMLKKPVSWARLCLADSLSELEALLGHIKTSNMLSELEMFYYSNTDNKTKGKRFYSSSPTRWNSGREKQEWGYKSSTRRSRDDLYLHSLFPRKTSFGYTPKYNTATMTYSRNFNGTETRPRPPLRSSRIGLYNTEAPVRKEPIPAEGSSSFRSSMEGTSRAESSLSHPQDSSISVCEKDPYVKEHRVSQKAHPSNDADSLPFSNIKSRKGSGDFAEVTQPSETQSKNDDNNVSPKLKSTLKLSPSRRPNRVAFSPEPEIREFSDDDSVEISQGEDNTQKAPDSPPVMDAKDQSRTDPSSKQSETHDTSLQSSFGIGYYSPGNNSKKEFPEMQQTETSDTSQQSLLDTGYYSQRNNSMEEFQEMLQTERENISLTKLTEVQPYSSYKQSRMQSMNPNQLAVDAMGSIESRASMPTFHSEEFNKAAYDQPNPDLQYVYQDSTEEVDSIYSQGKSRFQSEPSPFEISSESSGNSSEEGDVQSLDNRFPDVGISRHSSDGGEISQSSMVPIPAEGRKSRYIQDNVGLQNIFSPAFGKSKKSSFDVRGEDPQGSFLGRKSRFNLQDEEPSAPIFAAEARKSKFIPQDKDLPVPSFATEARKSRFIPQDKDPPAPYFAAEARKSRFISQDKEPPISGFAADLRQSSFIDPQITAGPIMAAGRRKSEIVNKDEQPSAPRISGEGRKSKYLMERDEDPSLDYQKSLRTPEQSRSTSPLEKSDCVSQESPRLAEIRNSRVRFDGEEDAPSSYQRGSSVCNQSSTQQSMRTYDMDESNYSAVPASSNYRRGSPVTHLGRSNSSSQSFNEVQLEHPQTPRVSESRKSRMIIRRDDDATWDYQRNRSSSQLSTTTRPSQDFNIREPNVSESLDQSETMNSRPPVLVVGRKSKIVMEGNDEDLVASSDYERAVSYSVQSDSAILTCDGVQLEQAETPTNSETGNLRVSIERDRDGTASGYQRNYPASMQYVDMIEPNETDVRRSDWDTVQPNDNEVPQSYLVRKSEWSLSNEPVMPSRLSMFRASIRAQKTILLNGDEE